MTQTVPTEIIPTSTTDLVLFSMPLPLNADYYGPEYFSPDSKWIALYLPQSKKTFGITNIFAQILISQRDSGIWTEVLSEDEQVDPSFEFAYSPDNHYLAAQGRSGIWIIDLQNFNSKTHYNLPILQSTVFNFKWTPDSKSVLFAIENKQYILAQLELDGRVKYLLTIQNVFQGKNKLELYDSLFFQGITFSPDGKKFAYVSALPEAGGCPKLWIYDLMTGNNELNVGNECVTSRQPIWSPTVSMIAFMGYDEINLFDLQSKTITPIYKMKDGSNVTRLFWSHDGKKILFNDPSFINKHRPIFIYDIDKKELRTVLMGEYLPIGWGNSDDSIFVVYQPWNSAEKYLQEIRID
jgi:Tol biopolymer transport system component